MFDLSILKTTSSSLSGKVEVAKSEVDVAGKVVVVADAGCADAAGKVAVVDTDVVVIGPVVETV